MGPPPSRVTLTDDLKIRQKIAEEAQISSATEASPAVRAFQFFLVPLLIVAGCVIVYAGLGAVMGSPRTASDWLEDIKSGGPSTRRHAALRMVQALRRQERHIEFGFCAVDQKAGSSLNKWVVGQFYRLGLFGTLRQPSAASRHARPDHIAEEPFGVEFRPAFLLLHHFELNCPSQLPVRIIVALFRVQMIASLCWHLYLSCIQSRQSWTGNNRLRHNNPAMRSKIEVFDGLQGRHSDDLSGLAIYQRQVYLYLVCA